MDSLTWGEKAMFTAGVWKVLDSFIHELKQRRWRRLRKRHLKSEIVKFVKCWQISLELNSKGLYQSSGKEKQNCYFLFSSSTKREIRHLHAVVLQRRLRNVQKSVIKVQSYCFANLNQLLICRSRCRRRRRCLSSLFAG